MNTPLLSGPASDAVEEIAAAAGGLLDVADALSEWNALIPESEAMVRVMPMPHVSTEGAGGRPAVPDVSPDGNDPALSGLLKHAAGTTQTVAVGDSAGNRRFVRIARVGPSRGTILAAVEVTDLVQALRAARRREVELKRRVTELAHAILRDPLTGLLNRRGMDNALRTSVATAARHGRPLSVLAIDVDNFKMVNKREGHSAGDRVLTTVGSIIQRSLRTDIDAAARRGGDEFVVVLPDADANGAVSVADRVRLAVGTTAIADGSHRLSCSVGVASFRQGDGPAELLARADAAVLLAKTQGKDRVVVDT